MNEPKRPIAIGHRGAPAFMPENTIASFRYAFEVLKADMVEFDVRFSRDKVPVVFHDRKLNRTTNGKGLVGKHSFRQLSELDAGYRFKPHKKGPFSERGKGHKISSLEEVLAAFPGKSFAVEIKENSRELTEAVLEILTRYGADRTCWVGSIKSRVAVCIQKTRPDVRRFLSEKEVLKEYISFRSRRTPKPSAFLATAAIPVKHLGLRFNSKGFIGFLKKRGIPVLFWTINNPSEIRNLLDLEADGIISDFPDRVVQALVRN